MQRRRVLLADDNPAILDYVAEMLAPEYEVVGSVADCKSVLPTTLALRPDVLILDISFGEMSGIEIAKQVCECSCAGAIVFLTVHEDPDFLRAAIGAGGSAYVVKSRLDMDLLPAIRAALCGRLFIASSMQYDGTG
jgi:DNA-binding NarL/FixJ family response regulator